MLGQWHSHKAANAHLAASNPGKSVADDQPISTNYNTLPVWQQRSACGVFRPDDASVIAQVGCGSGF